MARWMKLIGKTTRIRLDNAIQCLPDSLRGMSFAPCTAESGHPEKIHCHLTTTDGRERPEFHRAGNKHSGDYIRQRESTGGEQQHLWPRWLMQPVWLGHQEHYTWQCQGPSFPETSWNYDSGMKEELLEFPSLASCHKSKTWPSFPFSYHSPEQFKLRQSPLEVRVCYDWLVQELFRNRIWSLEQRVKYPKFLWRSRA